MSSIQILLIFIFATIAGMGSCLDEMQTHRPLIACTVTAVILINQHNNSLTNQKNMR